MEKQLNRYGYSEGARSRVKPVITIRVWTKNYFDDAIMNGDYALFAASQTEAVEKLEAKLNIKKPMIYKFLE